MNVKKTWRIQELHGALAMPVAMQITFAILAGLILDDGTCGRIVMTAIGGHWLMVAWIALRRPNALTQADTLLIRWGFFLWLPIAVFVMLGLAAILGQ